MARLEISDFRQGLNTNDASHEIGLAQSPALQNVDLSAKGKVKTRGGTSAINSGNTITSATGIYGAGYVKSKHIAVALTSIYSYSAGTSSYTAVSSGWTNNTDMYMHEWNNYAYFANGIEAPSKYDGTSFSAITSVSTQWGSGTYPDMITEHEERLWGYDFSTSKVTWSNLADGDNWTGTDDSGYHAFKPNDGFTGTGIVSQRGGLVVFKQQGIYIIRGKTPVSFNFPDQYKTVGCIAPRSIVNIGNRILFLGRWFGDYAVFALDGSGELNIVSTDIIPTLNLINSATDNLACAIEQKGKYKLSYPLSAGGWGAVNLNYQSGAWEYDTGNAMRCYYKGGNTIYGGSTSAGLVYQVDTGTSDNGVAITSYADTRNNLLEGADSDKQLNVLVVWAKASGSWDMNVNLYIDDKLIPETYKIPLGTKNASETTRRYVIKLNHKCTGNMIRFRFGTSTSNQPFELYKAILYYDVKQPANSN